MIGLWHSMFIRIPRLFAWLILLGIILTPQIGGIVLSSRLNFAMLCYLHDTGTGFSGTRECQQRFQALLEVPEIRSRAVRGYTGWLVEQDRFADVVELLNPCIQSQYLCDDISIARLAFAYNQISDTERFWALAKSRPRIGNYWLQRSTNAEEISSRIDLFETGLQVLSLGSSEYPSEQRIQLGLEYYKLAKIYGTRREREQELAAYERAVALAPSHPAVRLYYAIALAKDPATATYAVDNYKQVLNLTGEPFYRFSAYLGLADLSERQGSFQDALNWLLIAREDLPDYSLPFVALGLRHEAMEDYPSALSCYQRALAIDPDNPDANYFIALILKKKGAPSQVVKSHLQRALRNASKLYFVVGQRVSDALQQLPDSDILP